MCVHSTHSTMLLRWKYPFDDGVVINNFEVRIVQLPDALMSLAQQSGGWCCMCAVAHPSTVCDIG